MRGRVSRGLDVLASGLRRYVAMRTPSYILLEAEESRGGVATWDALSLLIFMWDNWNEVFRHDLTFVERSLVSELREYRNRWAHQQEFSERDIYRVMDNIERLLDAVKCEDMENIRKLRQESLRRLWNVEVGGVRSDGFLRKLWPYMMCGASGIALSAAIVSFGSSPWSWMLAILVLLAMMRIAWWQTVRESLHRHGPHECSQCGCIIYTEKCPYCKPVTVSDVAVGAKDRIVARMGDVGGVPAGTRGNKDLNRRPV